MHAALLTDSNTVRNYMLGGKATFTIKSLRTGMRFTYRVQVSDDGTRHYVSVLTGSDNDADYMFLGTVFDDTRYAHGKRSRIDAAAPSARAFEWLWLQLRALRLPADQLEFWTDGCCGRCGRTLTSEWAKVGFGPDCAEKLGIG